MKQAHVESISREGDFAAHVFSEIRRVVALRVDELLAARVGESNRGVQRARLDEVEELANRIAVVAFEQFGQPLVLADVLAIRPTAFSEDPR
jgi:hypothetical protein